MNIAFWQDEQLLLGSSSSSHVDVDVHKAVLFCIFRSSPKKRRPNKPGKNVRPSVHTYYMHTSICTNETQCSHKPNSGIC